MGFKAWITSSKEEREARYQERKAEIDAKAADEKAKLDAWAEGKRAELDAQKAARAHLRYQAAFRTMKVSDGRLKFTFGDSYPITDCTIDIIDGAGTSRMTATRVLAGGALAGGGGAVMGSLSRKDTTTFYMVIDTGVEMKKIKFSSGESAAAQHFALCFRKEQERIISEADSATQDSKGEA